MKPAYSQAAAELKKTQPNSYLAAVDGTKSDGLSQSYEIKGYPTIKYYENGEYKSDYNGGRTKDSIVSHMRESKEVKQVQPSVKDDWLDVYGHQHINFLDDTNFENFIKSKKKVLVMFYAPCKFK